MWAWSCLSHAAVDEVATHDGALRHPLSSELSFRFECRVVSRRAVPCRLGVCQVYLLVGSPVSQSDLENAGVSTAKAVLVMKDPR